MSLAKALSYVALILALVGAAGILVGYTTGVYGLWHLQWASLAALIIGVIAALLRGKGKPTKWPERLAVVMSLATLLMGILLPSLMRARELANRTACAANLRSIGTACQSYANTHGDFPVDLMTLVESGFLQVKQLRCPSDVYRSGDRNGSYVYIAGQDAAIDSDNAIACDKPTNHTGRKQDESSQGLGGNVLFADGRVEFISPYARVRELVETTKKHAGFRIAEASKDASVQQLIEPAKEPGASRIAEASNILAALLASQPSVEMPQPGQGGSGITRSQTTEQHLVALATLVGQQDGAELFAHAFDGLDPAERSALLVTFGSQPTIRKALASSGTPVLWETVQDALRSSSFDQRRTAVLFIAGADYSVLESAVAAVGTAWLIEALQSQDPDLERCVATILSRSVGRGSGTPLLDLVMTEATGTNRETLLPQLCHLQLRRLPANVATKLFECLTDESDSVRRSATLLLADVQMEEEQATWLAKADDTVIEAVFRVLRPADQDVVHAQQPPVQPSAQTRRPPDDLREAAWATVGKLFHCGDAGMALFLRLVRACPDEETRAALIDFASSEALLSPWSQEDAEIGFQCASVLIDQLVSPSDVVRESALHVLGRHFVEWNTPALRQRLKSNGQDQYILAAARSSEQRLRSSARGLVRFVIWEDASAPQGLLACLRSNEEPVRVAALEYVQQQSKEIISSPQQYLGVFEALLEFTIVDDEDVRTHAWHGLASCRGGLRSPAVRHAVASSPALVEAAEVPAKAREQARSFLAEAVGLDHEDRLAALTASLANPNLRSIALVPLQWKCRNRNYADRSVSGKQATDVLETIVTLIREGSPKERKQALLTFGLCARCISEATLLDAVDGKDGVEYLLSLAADTASRPADREKARDILLELLHTPVLQETVEEYLLSPSGDLQRSTIQFLAEVPNYKDPDRKMLSLVVVSAGG